MEEWQKRVVEEKAELEGKLHRLHVFLNGGMFHKLARTDQDLLDRQYHAMFVYHTTLEQRIARFGATT